MIIDIFLKARFAFIFKNENILSRKIYGTDYSFLEQIWTIVYRTLLEQIFIFKNELRNEFCFSRTNFKKIQNDSGTNYGNRERINGRIWNALRNECKIVLDLQLYKNRSARTIRDKLQSEF